MINLLTECLNAQRDAGFKFEDRREAKCPDCQATGYNTGWGYWVFTCGAEILTCGEIDAPCGNNKTGSPMTDFDITTVRKLTAKRNHPDTPPHLKQHLTNIIQTGENINAASPGTYREELIESFKRQWIEYVAAGGIAN